MFNCNICDYETNRKYNLDRHIKKHEKVPKVKNIKVYKCVDCDYTTKDKSNYNKHVKIHNAHLCRICDCKVTDITEHKKSMKHYLRIRREAKKQILKCNDNWYLGNEIISKKIDELIKQKGVKDLFCLETIYEPFNN